jgi:ribosomal protein L37AE/L43A
MPYLECPRCRRTAWLRAATERALECRHCGAPLGSLAGNDLRFLTGAVRERFARDARLNPGRPRFVRDSGPPHRVPE